MTNEDQLSLLPAVEIDGEDAADVAARWVEANEETWNEWFQEGPPPTTPATTRSSSNSSGSSNGLLTTRMRASSRTRAEYIGSVVTRCYHDGHVPLQ